MGFTNTFTQVLILFILILVGYFVRYKDLIDKNFTYKPSSLVLSVIYIKKEGITLFFYINYLNFKHLIYLK